MKDLAESLTSPIVKTKPEDQINRSQTGLEEPPSLPTAHTRSISLSSSMSNSSVTSALSKRPPPPVVDPDEMDGIEHIPSIGDSASNREDVGDSTIMIYQESYSHSPHQNRTHQTVNGATYPFPTSSTPSHTPTAHQYSHHALPNESRFFNQSPYAEYRGSGPDRYRHASSNHSRSSSLSISSLSQQSSIYGGEEQQIRSPSRLSGLKVHPGHQLSSHASQPNFRPPPLRSTPVRRTFPSLRHAMSQPAFHSPTGGSAASQPGSGSSYPPSLPPMSASSTGSQTHQYATFPPQPYSISPISAPPTHHLAHNTNHQHIPFPSRPRLDIQPNCHSRLSGHSTRFSREEESKECSNASGEESDSGFNEALGALETVMRFLQDQPTSFATPRDYMVVGELFGRMKEKKQEMINLGFGSQTSSSSGGRIGSQSCKNHYGGMNKSSANSTTSMSINTGGGVAGGNGLSLVLEDHGHGSSHSVPTRHEVEQDRDDRMEH
ncbi:hypothetical protein BY996DRAFT_7065257 [Phakopsora pachyrhizi]|nr:hypothetical protein BY996DRAFT_7065257 [Phakopsora pachyrhizi]